MSNKLLTIVPAIVVVGAIVVAVFALPSDDSSTSTSQNSNSPSSEVSEDDTNSRYVTTARTGKYVNYTPEAFAADTNPRKVLFFHSLTCVVCEQIDSNIEAGIMPDDVTLFRVQMEQEAALLAKYQVNVQTTLIQVDAEGEEIKDWNWLSKPFAGPEDIANELI